MIIGISGYMGSGKDTVANIIRYLGEYPSGEQVTDYKNRRSYNSYVMDLGMDDNVDGHYKWKIKKWAGKLKQIASILTGIPIENFEDQEFKKTEMGAQWGMSVREFLQKLGSEALRDGLHKEVWINALMSDYKVQRRIGGFSRTIKSAEGIPYDYEYEVEYPNWVVSDTRYPNEALAIKEQGGIIIRVNRFKVAGMNEVHLHSSETSLDDWHHDEIIDNNGTIEDLIPKVKRMMETHGLL